MPNHNTVFFAFKDKLVSLGLNLCLLVGSVSVIVWLLVAEPVVRFNQWLAFSRMPPDYSRQAITQTTKESLQLVTNPEQFKGSVFLTTAEIHHLQDVMPYVKLGREIAIPTLVLAGLLLIWYGKIDFQLMKKTTVVIEAVLIGGTVIGVLWWDTFFLHFHEVLFPQGNWTFPPESYLIQSFPVLFWMINFGELIIGSILGIHILLLILQSRRNV